MCVQFAKTTTDRRKNTQTNKTKQQTQQQQQQTVMKRFKLDLPNCFMMENTAKVDILLFLIRKNIFQRGFRWTEYVFLNQLRHYHLSPGSLYSFTSRAQ